MPSAINPKLQTFKNMNLGKNVFLRNLGSLNNYTKSINKYLENCFAFGSAEDKAYFHIVNENFNHVLKNHL